MFDRLSIKSTKVKFLFFFFFTIEPNRQVDANVSRTFSLYLFESVFYTALMYTETKCMLKMKIIYIFLHYYFLDVFLLCIICDVNKGKRIHSLFLIAEILEDESLRNNNNWKRKQIITYFPNVKQKAESLENTAIA